MPGSTRRATRPRSRPGRQPSPAFPAALVLIDPVAAGLQLPPGARRTGGRPCRALPIGGGSCGDRQPQLAPLFDHRSRSSRKERRVQVEPRRRGGNTHDMTTGVQCVCRRMAGLVSAEDQERHLRRQGIRSTQDRPGAPTRRPSGAPLGHRRWPRRGLSLARLLRCPTVPLSWRQDGLRPPALDIGSGPVGLASVASGLRATPWRGVDTPQAEPPQHVGHDDLRASSCHISPGTSAGDGLCARAHGIVANAEAGRGALVHLAVR